MADKEFKSVTAYGRIVYNLDVVNSFATKVLTNSSQIALQSASAALINALPDTSLLLKAFEPMRKAVEIIQESFQKVWEQVREAIDRITKPLSFLLSTRPIYFVPPGPVVLQEPQEQHLAVSNDPYGFFLIDGRQLNILHPASSRCGKLLATLLKRRATIVDYKTLQQEIGSGDLDKTFKDLHYQLRQRGYELDYKRPRTQGIALIGIRELQ